MPAWPLSWPRGPKRRAGMVFSSGKASDEGLDILTGLWHGQPFNYEGKHYTIKKSRFPHPAPPSVQRPRIPIWVRRALHSHQWTRKQGPEDNWPLQ